MAYWIKHLPLNLRLRVQIWSGSSVAALSKQIYWSMLFQLNCHLVAWLTCMHGCMVRIGRYFSAWVDAPLFGTKYNKTLGIKMFHWISRLKKYIFSTIRCFCYFGSMYEMQQMQTGKAN